MGIGEPVENESGEDAANGLGHEGSFNASSSAVSTDGTLWAISDLHVHHPANNQIIESLRPSSPNDWLIACGDIAEKEAEVVATLKSLSERFSQVIWVPGNHELWTSPSDPCQLRGADRYDHLVDTCRTLGVLTPEDPYPIWKGIGGPARLVPMFILYDYSFGANIAETKEASLEIAYKAGVVCSDEFLLHPDPYETREQWCEARVTETERQLDALPRDLPLVLINHFPLTDIPTHVLRHPEFAQWCGTYKTADWHIRYNTTTVVYGHLHIPRTIRQDGVRFEEVSLGYPRERRRRKQNRPPLRQILFEQEPDDDNDPRPESQGLWKTTVYRTESRSS